MQPLPECAKFVFILLTLWLALYNWNLVICIFDTSWHRFKIFECMKQVGKHIEFLFVFSIGYVKTRHCAAALIQRAQ